MALASERRVASSSFMVVLCSAAVGTVEGLVADVRAESRTRDKAGGLVLSLKNRRYLFHERTRLLDWIELLQALSCDWLSWLMFVALLQRW